MKRRSTHSILTKYEEISVFSQREKECSHHLISGRGLRELADQDGLTIPLTNDEHNMAADPVDRIHGNPTAEKMSKMLGQLAWEKEYYRQTFEAYGELAKGHDPAREAFRKRYGISYL